MLATQWQSGAFETHTPSRAARPEKLLAIALPSSALPFLLRRLPAPKRLERRDGRRIRTVSATTSHLTEYFLTFAAKMSARTIRALAEGRFGELFLIAGKTVVNAFKRGPSNRFEGVPPEQLVQSLRSRATASRWISGSDSSIGGMSECSLSFEEGKDEVDEDGRQPPPGAEGVEGEEPSPVAVVPEGGGFLKFTGTVSLECAPGKDLFRTGYCAMRSPMFEPALDLDVFEGLRMRVRTDGRAYSVNVKVDSIVDEDLYQGFVLVPSSFGDAKEGGDGGGDTGVEGLEEEDEEDEGNAPWVEVELPFRNLILTYGGSPKVEQRKLERGDKVRLQSIGITIADGVEGDFRFDLQEVKAVRECKKGHDRRAHLLSQGFIPEEQGQGPGTVGDGGVFRQ